MKEEITFEKNLMKYLNEKNWRKQTIQFILPEAVSVLNLEGEWKNILSSPSRKGRVNQTIQLWEKNVKDFQMIIRLLKERLISIDTVLYNEKLNVVYSLQAHGGTIYYIGALPQSSYEGKIVNQLPETIKNFYFNVHDGFVMYPSEDMGLAATSDIYCLGDDLLQEEFIDGYSVKDAYMIFSNGGGDGVVYDVSHNPPKGFTYFHDDYDECDFKENPIDVIGSWIQIALSEEW